MIFPSKFVSGLLLFTSSGIAIGVFGLSSLICRFAISVYSALVAGSLVVPIRSTIPAGFDVARAMSFGNGIVLSMGLAQG